MFADNRIMMHLQGLGVVWTLFEKISMISGALYSCLGYLCGHSDVANDVGDDEARERCVC